MKYTSPYDHHDLCGSSAEVTDEIDRLVDICNARNNDRGVECLNFPQNKRVFERFFILAGGFNKEKPQDKHMEIYNTLVGVWDGCHCLLFSQI